MRWKTQIEPSWPPDGSKRIVQRFLWLPVSATNTATYKKETRWFESATYLVEVTYWVNSFTKNRTRWTWEPVEWIDTEEQKARALDRHGYQISEYKQWQQEAQ